MNLKKSVYKMLCRIMGIYFLIGVQVNGQEIKLPIRVVDYQASSLIKQVSKSDAQSENEEVFDLNTVDDLRTLETLCKNSKLQIKVNDNLPVYYGGELGQLFDALDQFYYNVPSRYPNICEITQRRDVIDKDARMKAKYDKLGTIPLGKWIAIEDPFKVLAQPKYTVFVPVPKVEGQYVEYKVNEKNAGTTSRYPYVWDIDEVLLHPGVNQVRAIVYNKNQEPRVYSFYVSSKNPKKYSARQPRVKQQILQNNERQGAYIPVLMYHEFLKTVPKEQQSIAVSTRLFELQLTKLLEEGYTPINFYDLQLYLNKKVGLPPNPVIITADDGYLSNYTEAYPILKKYKVQATFFVSTAYVGDMSFYQHFTWQEAGEMEKSGLIDIQSHSHRHLPMDGLNQVEVDYEVNTSFDEIEAHLGERDVKVLAYPEFRHTSQVQKWVKEAGVALQVTHLVRKPVATTALQIRRIHVSDDMSPEELIQMIQKMKR